jgi:hypothetical protein
MPVSRATYAAMVVPTAHITFFGFCIHDYTTSPCEMFRKCLDCREHLCVKGLRDNTERIRQTLEGARNSLVKARKAVAEAVYGAANWVTVHAATVERLEELLRILNDPNVQDGAVVQLSASNTYTLSEGALMDRLALDEAEKKASVPDAANEEDSDDSPISKSDA